MRGGKGWNIALVHRVAAPEEHRIRHPGPIKMRASRLGIFPRINIRPHHVAGIIHVIAEYGRDVVCVLGENGVVTWRSGKTRFASGDGRFGDQMFALVKVRFLLADMHNDLRRTGNAFVIPPTCNGGAGIEAGRIRRILLATANNERYEACAQSLKQTAWVHGSGYLCA